MLNEDKTESLPKTEGFFVNDALMNRIHAVQGSDTTKFNACNAAHQIKHKNKTITK
jgi:hypothetical protein